MRAPFQLVAWTAISLNVLKLAEDQSIHCLRDEDPPACSTAASCMSFSTSPLVVATPSDMVDWLKSESCKGLRTVMSKYAGLPRYSGRKKRPLQRFCTSFACKCNSMHE